MENVALCFFRCVLFLFFFSRFPPLRLFVLADVFLMVIRSTGTLWNRELRISLGADASRPLDPAAHAR